MATDGAESTNAMGIHEHDPERRATEADVGAAEQAHAASSVSTPQYETPRRPSAERENAFNVLAWLAEGATGLIEELRHNDLGLPEEFWSHAYAARRESLLAAHALLEHLIQWSEQPSQAEREREQRRARRGNIDIDF